MTENSGRDMPSYTTSDIRNIAIAGKAGSGKTTLVDAVLFAAGAIARAGRTEDKNTVCDFDDLEKEVGHSLESAMVHFDYSGRHVNIIDTPGAPGLMGATMSSLPAVETLALVIDPTAGIDSVTRRLFKLANERNIPRMIIVNKIDSEAALDVCLDGIKETFGMVCQAINLPADGGVIDCFRTSEGSSDLGDVADFHTSIVDQVVEIDEALMEEYLEQGEVSPEALGEAFGRAMCEGHLVPVCFCSAREGTGITELLDSIVGLCPDPTSGNPRPFECGEGDEVTAWTPTMDPDGPPMAHVFKVSSDPFVGKLSIFKVHSGHIGSSIHPRIDDGRKGIRISHVHKLMGKDHTELDKIIAGDIGAVAKIDDIEYNSCLHDGSIGDHLHIKAVALPKPMFGLAIEASTKGAESKLSEALAKMTMEDPTLVVDRVAATHETVLRGLGEEHLRNKIRMLKERYAVEVDTRQPKVAYKETILGKAEGHHRHKKQSGGSGQFGEVYLRVEPLVVEEGDDEVVGGLVFVDATFGGSIPKSLIPAVEKGIRQVMIHGAVAGYPMTNIKVSVYDGKYHAVDSKEIAFITAGKRAFIDAIQKASPVLLEPYVNMEITVPSAMIGDISSDLAGRRARISGTDMLPGNQAVVMAEAPLAEVMAYSTQLRSMTAGAGAYSMEYSRDDATPPNIQADVVKSFKPKSDDD
jgi:elongation factor G